MAFYGLAFADYEKGWRSAGDTAGFNIKTDLEATNAEFRVWLHAAHQELT